MLAICAILAVDSDELSAGLKRIHNGEAPRTVGNAAAKLAAKEAASAETKAAMMAAKMACKDAKSKTHTSAIGVAPARVAPAPARVLPAPARVSAAPAVPSRPPPLVMWDPVGAFSPAMMRAAKAISPAVKNSLAAIPPAVAKAAGVSELYAQVYTPNTLSKQRLDKWTELANQEKSMPLQKGTARREKWAHLAYHQPAPASMRPPARLQACQ